MNLDCLKAQIKDLIGNTSRKASVINALKKAGLFFTDCSNEYGYSNIHIPAEKGYIRIYKPYKEKFFTVQIFRKVNYVYSGIPTFEPSGRKSF